MRNTLSPRTTADVWKSQDQCPNQISIVTAQFTTIDKESKHSAANKIILFKRDVC